jgi:simple sugar transport system substrate-binding protein
MIELDGAKIIFPTSFGYFDPHVLAVAKDHPDITFLHCGGLWTEGKHPKHVGSYFGYIDECEYLSGIVAGHMTKSKKLGFVAAKPIPQVQRNINAFTLGARSVDPSIQCFAIFTGDWSDPKKEAEATTGLLDKGVDVMTCHVDSPKVVVETAERRGAYTCGYHCSQATLAPKGYLTGAEWNWEKVYTDYVKDFKAGKKIPNLVRGGIKEGIVKPSPYGAPVSEKAKMDADSVMAKFKDGTFVIFKGPMKDNTGKVILEDGKALPQTAIELEKMNYLVEGAIGQ